MDTGYAASIATIVLMGLSFLGVSGVDAGVVNSAVVGVFAIFGIATSIWAHYKRPTALQS